jgi:hypothetical protein
MRFRLAGFNAAMPDKSRNGGNIARVNSSVGGDVKEMPMRGLTLALLAAGTIAMAVPASAEDLYVGAGRDGVRVGVDSGYRHHRDRDVTVVHRDGYARAHCRTTIIKRDGMTKKIKKCD